MVWAPFMEIKFNCLQNRIKITAENYLTGRAGSGSMPDLWQVTWTCLDQTCQTWFIPWGGQSNNLSSGVRLHTATPGWNPGLCWRELYSRGIAIWFSRWYSRIFEVIISAKTWLFGLVIYRLAEDLQSKIENTSRKIGPWLRTWRYTWFHGGSRNQRCWHHHGNRHELFILSIMRSFRLHDQDQFIWFTVTLA